MSCHIKMSWLSKCIMYVLLLVILCRVYMSFIPSAIMHIAHGQRRHFKGAFNAIIPRVLTVIGTSSTFICILADVCVCVCVYVAATIAWLYAALNTNK